MKPTTIYRVIAALLFVIGLLSLMNTISGYTIHQQFLWKSALFAVMDFSVAWGFYKRHSWLPHLLGLNVVGQIALFVLQSSALGGFAGYYPLFGLALAGILFAFVHATKRLLRTDSTSQLAAAGFLLPWAISFGYTVLMWI